MRDLYKTIAYVEYKRAVELLATDEDKALQSALAVTSLKILVQERRESLRSWRPSDEENQPSNVTP
jgi:hypothetical protein